jgi:hypothetical protein
MAPGSCFPHQCNALDLFALEIRRPGKATQPEPTSGAFHPVMPVPRQPAPQVGQDPVPAAAHGPLTLRMGLRKLKGARLAK